MLHTYTNKHAHTTQNEHERKHSHKEKHTQNQIMLPCKKNAIINFCLLILNYGYNGLVSKTMAQLFYSKMFARVSSRLEFWANFSSSFIEIKTASFNLFQPILCLFIIWIGGSFPGFFLFVPPGLVGAYYLRPQKHMQYFHIKFYYVMKRAL